jgi:hypothetical protein
MTEEKERSETLSVSHPEKGLYHVVFSKKPNAKQDMLLDTAVRIEEDSEKIPWLRRLDVSYQTGDGEGGSKGYTLSINIPKRGENPSVDYKESEITKALPIPSSLSKQETISDFHKTKNYAPYIPRLKKIMSGGKITKTNFLGEFETLGERINARRLLKRLSKAGILKENILDKKKDVWEYTVYKEKFETL